MTYQYHGYLRPLVPPGGSKPLPAWVVSEEGDEWWDCCVANALGNAGLCEPQPAPNEISTRADVTLTIGGDPVTIKTKVVVRVEETN